MTEESLIIVFDSMRQGLSVDRVLADPDLRSALLAGCGAVDPTVDERLLTRRLLNLRKEGKLSGLKSKRTSFDDEEYRFAAEIAVRHIERKNQVTLDEILCDPLLLTEYDAICEELAPGFSRLQYRWAALSLRKSRSIAPEVVSQALPSDTVTLLPCRNIAIESLPNSPGLYVFINPNEVLYVGEASNLRLRIRKHLDHSDNKHLARYMWEFGLEGVHLEMHVLPAETPTRVRRALETELIRSRKPTYNVIGVLSE